jgi:hypothetical protein
LTAACPLAALKQEQDEEAKAALLLQEQQMAFLLTHWKRSGMPFQVQAAAPDTITTCTPHLTP